MKASELIKWAQEFIECHGDKPVEIVPNGVTRDTRKFLPCTGYSKNGNPVCFSLILNGKVKKGGKR